MLRENVILLLVMIAACFGQFSTDSNVSGEVDKKFRLVCDAKSKAGNIPISIFESLRTGLRVVVAEADGPIVQGVFTVATEPENDDGLSHALKHLFFTGSEDYPYNGFLLSLANRCLAKLFPVSAERDHISYTVETAGKDGFISILPVYLDHLFFPTLTNAAFLTEIHHITKEGEDAGVMYSELQKRENTMSEMTANTLMELMYPAPSAYRFKPNGTMKNLRSSTNNLKVRKFHEKFYRPENVHITVLGKSNVTELFQVIHEFEDKIIEKKNFSTPFQRPWSRDPLNINSSKEVTVNVPSNNENTGILRIGWRGPSVVHQILEVQSLEILLGYLSLMLISPPRKSFIGNKKLLRSYVHGYPIQNRISTLSLEFRGIPIRKMNLTKEKLFEALRNISSNESLIDMKLMQEVINKKIVQQHKVLEASTHSFLSQAINQYVVYGENCGYLDKLLNKDKWFKALLKKPSKYWIDLTDKYLLNRPYVIVKGIPSKNELKSLEKSERERIQLRKVVLGKKGLLEWKEKVENATKTNEVPPPPAFQETVPIPSYEGIEFFKLKTFTNVQNQILGNISKTDPEIFDMDALDFKIQIDDINSNFVTVIAILDTRNLTYWERLHIPLLLELILESPIESRNGSMIAVDDVVRRLNSDTVEANVMRGIRLKSPFFSNYISINFKLEMENYDAGVELMTNVLFNVKFDNEKISMKAEKLLKSINLQKRNGPIVAKILQDEIHFKKESNINAANILRQEKFLRILMDISREPNATADRFDQIYQKITKLDGLTVHLATNLNRLASLTNVTRPWINFQREARSKNVNFNFGNVVMDRDLRKNKQKLLSNATTGFIAGIQATKWSFLIQRCPIEATYAGNDVPALLTLLMYFNQKEGPIWKEISGSGLGVGYLITQIDKGFLNFHLTKASQLAKAYEIALNIYESHVNGSVKWSQHLFESARRSIVYKMIKFESEFSDIVQQSVLSYFSGVSNYKRNMLKVFEKLTLNDMEIMAHKFLIPLMNPKLSTTVIVCPESKMRSMQQQFTKFGHNLEIINSLEKSRNSLEKSRNSLEKSRFARL